MSLRDFRNRLRESDRGLAAAAASMGVLVAIGVLLIVRARPSTPPAALPDEPAITLIAPAPGNLTSAHVEAPRDAGADARTEPVRPPPAWRAATLKGDPAFNVSEGTFGKRGLAAVLAQTSLSKAEARRVAHAFESVRKIERLGGKEESKASYVLAVDRAKGTAVAFEVVLGPSEVWQLHEGDRADKLSLFVDERPVRTALVVTGDLPKAIAASGLREDILPSIDDALDGHLETSNIGPGARLRVAAAEEWVDGTFAGYRIDAIEYVPRAGLPLRVYLNEGEHKSTHGYYDAKGQKPYKGAFRSPLPLVRVSSRFNPRRMHPILHIITPHNGVDFRASTGTPVYASATGTIVQAGNAGPCGNMIEIEHAGGLTTAYCHLSRIAAGVHSGMHVEARQLVGYVGQTGRATGPHLHFAAKRGGVFIDPLALKLDGVRVLPRDEREAFARRRAELDGVLDTILLPAIGDVLDRAEKADKDDKREDDDPAGEE